MREDTSPTIVVHDFDPNRFWAKLRRFAARAGRVVVERARRLYYASQDTRTPAWAKRSIYAGLAYFIVPFDLIPDFISGIGYTDDATTLRLTLSLRKRGGLVDANGKYRYGR
jgi:uncharacterized membrane protein YkvA (DUF1232 family)